MGKFIKPLKISCKDKDSWYEERNRLLIGGSDITAILGLESKYRTPLDVYRVIKGFDQRFVGNKATLRGNFIEDGIAKYWEYETGHVIIKASAQHDLYIHPKYKWLGGSPDRRFYYQGSKAKSDICILEIKTTKKKIDVAEIPKGWFIQPNFYTGLLGYKKFVICWFEMFTDEIKWQEFDFNQKLYDLTLKGVLDFYNNNLMKNIAPSPLTESDILKLYPEEEVGKIIVANEMQLDQYSLIIDLRRQSNSLKKQYDSATEIIKVQMADAERMIDQFDNILFTYKVNKNGSRVFLPKEI